LDVEVFARNTMLLRPELDNRPRIRNEVEFYKDAVQFAKTYDLTIVEVSGLKRNLKFDITYKSNKTNVKDNRND